MPAHLVFTEIDARSYDAIVKNGYLSEVLLALLVDPLEAEDVADSIKSVTETAIELNLNGRAFAAPIGLADFQNLPSKDGFEKMKITLSQWVMTTERADMTAKKLAMWDRRFGIWCACAVVREAMRFIFRSKKRLILAIETTQAWVLGMATLEQVSEAVEVASKAYDAAAYAADVSAPSHFYAASRSSSAALHVTEAAYYAITADVADDVADAAYAAVSSAAYAASSQANDWENFYEEELVRLRKVVANACLTFPG